jgi:uncharacterized protein YggE
MKDQNIFFKIIVSVILFFLTLASIYCIIFTINFSHPKPSLDPQNNLTISAVGRGEVDALPDIAIINATITDFAPLVSTAQEMINDKAKNLAIELDKLGIDKKDIRSTNYRSGPKYQQVPIKCEDASCGFKSEISGYEASQTIKITVSKLELAGDVMTELGKLGINQISGPNFAIENSDKLKSSARLLAIKDSQAKAQEIAQGLGAQLDKIIGFSENNYPHHQIMFKSMSAMSDSRMETKATLFAGEETVKSEVTITYSTKYISKK